MQDSLFMFMCNVYISLSNYILEIIFDLARYNVYTYVSWFHLVNFIPSATPVYYKVSIITRTRP